MSLLINYFACPQCGEKTRAKYQKPKAETCETWFGCKNEECRHHWLVMTSEGMEPKIIAESPRGELQRRVLAHQAAGKADMGCPRCGRYGMVKSTERRTDNATVRRHKCPTDGYYFSCTDVDGNVEITKLRPSMKVRDAA